MNAASLLSSVVLSAAMVLVGWAFGRTYFWSLRRTVDRHCAGRSGWGPAGLTLARLSGALLVFAGMARLGSAPLVAGFLGFLLARQWALHAAKAMR